MVRLILLLSVLLLYVVVAALGKILLDLAHELTDSLVNLLKVVKLEVVDREKSVQEGEGCIGLKGTPKGKRLEHHLFHVVRERLFLGKLHVQSTNGILDYVGVALL